MGISYAQPVSASAGAQGVSGEVIYAGRKTARESAAGYTYKWVKFEDELVGERGDPFRFPLEPGKYAVHVQLGYNSGTDQDAALWYSLNGEKQNKIGTSERTWLGGDVAVLGFVVFEITEAKDLNIEFYRRDGNSRAMLPNSSILVTRL